MATASTTTSAYPVCDADDNQNYTEPDYGDQYTIKCNYDFDHGNNTASYGSTPTFAECIEKCSQWNREDHTSQYYYDPQNPQYDFPPATLESYPMPGPYKCLGVNYYDYVCYIKNSLDQRNQFSYMTSSALLTEALDTEPDNYTAPASPSTVSSTTLVTPMTPTTSPFTPSSHGTSGFPSNSANSTSGFVTPTGSFTRPSQSITNSANSTSARSVHVISFSLLTKKVLVLIARLMYTALSNGSTSLQLPPSTMSGALSHNHSDKSGTIEVVSQRLWHYTLVLRQRSADAWLESAGWKAKSSHFIIIQSADVIRDSLSYMLPFGRLSLTSRQHLNALLSIEQLCASS